MAKGSNNVRSRTSDASKPYDVSNSFVKRVASRVTELLPQPSSWLSRWISPASVPNASDFTGLSLSSTITSRPPATTRAELNLVESIDHHIPVKKPRTIRYNSPVNQNKFLRSDVYSAEDISPIPTRGEPVAGPSSALPELIASTPAVQQPSTKVNGDDCSETSESTSGCSSLVPQTQSTSRSLGGSRYGRVLPPGVNLDSLHRRRPSFSTAAFASPLRANMRERLGTSPFYSGRTMYGGSSQAYLTAVHSPQRRVGPTVKPLPAQQQSLPLSSTAKRILDALEQFSTPVMDAKRMPVVGSKRKANEIGTHGYTALSIPSTPDLLRVKRRERLQQSTSAARQAATASPPSPTTSQEYSVRQEETDRKKHTGKVKTKEKVADEVLVEVKLPSVVLSVNNLPKIDIAIPPPPSAVPVCTACQFKFAAPTAVPHSGNELPPPQLSTSPFKFSAPIGESSMDSNKPVFRSSNSESSSSRTSCDNVTSHLKRQISKDGSVEHLDIDSVVNTHLSLLPSSSRKLPSSPAPSTVQSDLKECKVCHAKVQQPGIACCCQQMKISTYDKTINTTSQWQCSVCKTSNPSNCKDCSSCSTKSKSVVASKNNVKLSSTGFGDLYKKPLGTWECSECMLQNKSELAKCIDCESPKPVKKDSLNTAKSVTPKLGSWECQTCLYSNKSNASSCVSCETPKENPKPSSVKKPETKIDTVPSGSGFGNMFKKAPGSWTCDSCMITNNAEKIKCEACGTLKPGATLPKSLKSSGPKFSFGIPTTFNTSGSDLGTTFNFGISKGDQPVPTQNSCFLLPKPIGDKSQSEVFSFGIPEVTKKAKDNLSGVSSTTSKAGFQFGSTSASSNESESTSTSLRSKQNVPDSILSDNTNVKSETGKEVSSLESKPQFSSATNAVSISVSASINTTVKSAMPAFNVKSGPEKSSNSALFTFGSNKISQNTVDIITTKAAQPGFMFDNKQVNFGSNMASSTTSTISTSSPSSMFQFGDTNTVSSGSSLSSASTQPSLTTATKTNNTFNFGSSVQKKEVSFGIPSTKESMPVSVDSMKPAVENKPTFGSFATPVASPFGNTNAFACSSFSSKEQPSNPFVPQTTSNVFGSTETTNAASSTLTGFGQTNAFQVATQESKPSAVFTFGSTASKDPATPGGFVFNPVTPKPATTPFGFTAPQTNTPSAGFGFNNVPSAPSTTFNFEPKPFPQFGTTSEAPTSVFGATVTQQPTPTFGEQTNPNSVFAFGSQPSQTPANPMFEFTSNQSQSTPALSPAFVFGSTPAAPTAPAFNPNIKPTFNFSQGTTPTFSAIPAINPTGTPQPPTRKIRKAVRRTNLSSVRQT